MGVVSEICGRRQKEILSIRRAEARRVVCRVTELVQDGLPRLWFIRWITRFVELRRSRLLDEAQQLVSNAGSVGRQRQERLDWCEKLLEVKTMSTRAELKKRLAVASEVVLL